MNVYDVIKRPLTTEKTTDAQVFNKYVFEVAAAATKNDIRNAVETLFNVSVEGVNTAIMQGKRKRFGRTMGKRSNWKKAVVSLKDGDAIDFYMGGEEEL